MIQIRRSAERGHFNHGWLDTFHTFSFAGYQDPRFMGFRSLRVLNEDRLAPGGGFPPHPHRDMEILSYVVEGALEHQDSTGAHFILPAGGVQVMTAGSGVVHSEYNASQDKPVHFLQIWIEPERPNLAPRHAERVLVPVDLRNRLALIASPDGRDDALLIHQDARVYAMRLEAGGALRHVFDGVRYAWIQSIQGTIRVNGIELMPGDAVACIHELVIALEAVHDSEALLFDLA